MLYCCAVQGYSAIASYVVVVARTYIFAMSLSIIKGAIQCLYYDIVVCSIFSSLIVASVCVHACAG